MHVNEEYRNKGLGSKLLARITPLSLKIPPPTSFLFFPLYPPSSSLLSSASPLSRICLMTRDSYLQAARIGHPIFGLIDSENKPMLHILRRDGERVCMGMVSYFIAYKKLAKL